NCTARVARSAAMVVSNQDFATAMRAHHPKLYRTACFLTGNHHEGEVLIQETLLEAWKSGNSFVGPSSVCPWVPPTLIRRSHRWQRRQMVRRLFFPPAADQKESQTFID